MNFHKNGFLAIKMANRLLSVLPYRLNLCCNQVNRTKSSTLFGLGIISTGKEFVSVKVVAASSIINLANRAETPELSIISRMNLKILMILTVISVIQSCEPQCFEGYVFYFKATNDLTQTQIMKGDSITVKIEFPEEALSRPDSMYYPIDNFDFYTQVNFRKYVSPYENFQFQEEAFDDFKWTVLQGKSVSSNEVSPGLTNNAIYLLLDRSSPTREVIFSIKPQRKGTYFMYLESKFDLQYSTQQKIYDDDECFDQTLYGFYNATKNDYSFLEGIIQDTITKHKTFLNDVAGLAFMVYE